MNSRIYWELSQAYNNLYENNHIIDYLIDGGFASSVDGARVIAENMGADWYNFIVEGLKKTDTSKPSEMSARIQELDVEIRKLKELSKRPGGLSPEQQIKLAKLSKEQSTLRTAVTQAGHMRREPEPTAVVPGELRPSSRGPANDRLKELRGQLKELKSGPPTPLTLSKIADLEWRIKKIINREQPRPVAPGRGQSPSTSKKEAPDRGATNRQTEIERRASELAREAGHQDPTYYDQATGTRKPLRSTGDTIRIRSDATRKEKGSGVSPEITQPRTLGAANRGGTRNPRN